MKTLADILSEETSIDNIQTTKLDTKKVKLKNKIVINPDFSSYQARTHKDADTAVPLDTVKKDATGAVLSTAIGAN